MAIATDIEVNWVDTIDNTNKIGLSKPLNQLGANIFNSADYCVGYNNKALKLTKESESYPKSTDAGATNVPFYISDNTGYTKNTANTPEGVYYRTILFAVPNNFTWGWDANVRADNAVIRIVTKLNLQKNKLYLTTAETQKNALTVAPVYTVNESIEGTTANGTFLVDNVSYYINCADVYLTESGYYIKFQTYIDNMYDNFNPTYGEGILGNFNYDTNSSTMFSASPVMFANANYKVLIQGSEPNAYMIQNWSDTELDIAPDADNTDIKFFATYHLVSPYYWHTFIKYSVEYALWISASYGLMFEWNGVPYKPVIQGGALKGYTNDMTVPSDIDNWTDVSGHNISPTPPSPSGDDPSDDQAWGGAYSGAGAFSKFYLCTATDLANLRTWFGGGGGGDQIPNGFDPMGQVLGLLQYPVSIAGTALAPDEITFRSGKTILHTGVNADRSTGGFLHLDCGSVEIPRRMQQRGVPFLDFETSLEIYVPFCGTAPLDVQTCVGKTLTCDMYVATATGDVSAVIAAGGHPVAYMSGNMAESLPISSSGYGMYLAACKSTWGNGVSQVMNQLTGGTTSTIKNVNQAALNETLSYGQTGGWGQSELLAESYNNPAVGRGMAGAASAKGVAAIGLTTTALNVANAASTGYEQYQRVKNASYTSVSGSFTSCAAWNYPFTPYVKITRPHQQIPQGGRGDYKHTAGIPLVETKTLSGAPGLTTCVNPDVSGIANATAQEKDIIYRALVNGVIV